jgi:hypothetical protein
MKLNIALSMTLLLSRAVAFAPTHSFATRRSSLFLFDKLFSSTKDETSSTKLPVVAPESAMDKKAHGTSEAPVQNNLRWVRLNAAMHI